MLGSPNPFCTPAPFWPFVGRRLFIMSAAPVSIFQGAYSEPPSATAAGSATAAAAAAAATSATAIATGAPPTSGSSTGIASPAHCELLDGVQRIVDDAWLQWGPEIAGELGYKAVRMQSARDSHPPFPIFASMLGAIPSLANGHIPPFASPCVCPPVALIDNCRRPYMTVHVQHVDPCVLM